MQGSIVPIHKLRLTIRNREPRMRLSRVITTTYEFVDGNQLVRGARAYDNPEHR